MQDTIIFDTNITVTKPIVYGPDFDLVQGTIIQPLPSTPGDEHLLNFKVIYCPNNEFTNETSNMHLQELF